MIAELVHLPGALVRQSCRQGNAPIGDDYADHN